MSIFTKHNNYEIPTGGTAAWGTVMDANITLIERGITIKGTAGTTILQNDVVYLDSNFKFDLAIAGGAADAGKWVGYATTNLNIDTQGYALHHGYVAGGSWDFTAGPVYLSDVTAGAVTQTAPVNSIITGFAIQTTEILIKPWVEATPPVTDIGEGHITLYPPTGTYHSSVGDWSISNHNSQIYRHYRYNNDNNNLDYLTYKVYMAANKPYSFKVLGISSANAGYGEILIDDVPVGATFDTYTSSLTYNATFNVAAGFTVATSGVKDYKIRINGKNSAASMYRLYLSTLCMYRTA